MRTDEAALVEARAGWPAMAEKEADAALRLAASLAGDEVAAGAQALADWIDARAAMLLMLAYRQQADTGVSSSGHG
jgi:hypothetical protein